MAGRCVRQNEAGGRHNASCVIGLGGLSDVADGDGVCAVVGMRGDVRPITRGGTENDRPYAARR